MSVEQDSITEIYCRSCNRPLYSWDREGLCSVCYRLKWSKIVEGV